MGLKKRKDGKYDTGRSTVMTPQVLAKLEECFAKGYNDYQSYKSAGISKDAFYDYKKSHPDFSEKIQWLKDNPLILAKENVYDKIAEGDIKTSQWYLERKAKDEFSLRTENIGISTQVKLDDKDDEIIKKTFTTIYGKKE